MRRLCGLLKFYGAATNLVAPCFALLETAYYKLFRKSSWTESLDLLSQRLSLTNKLEVSNAFRSPVSLWFHGASLGETRTAIALCAAVLRNFYDKNSVLLRHERSFNLDSVLFTSANVAAQEPLSRGLGFLYKTSSEKGVLADFHGRLMPYDFPNCVRRFLLQFLPQTAIFIESELWPFLLRESKNRGVKLLLLDGRLSPTSKERWTSTECGRKLLRETLNSFSFIGARNEEEAYFFKQQGCSNVKVIPPLKTLAQPELDTEVTSPLTSFGPKWMVC